MESSSRKLPLGNIGSETSARKLPLAARKLLLGNIRSETSAWKHPLGTYESHRSLVMAQTCVGLEQHVNQENTPCTFIQSHELLIVAHSLTNAASLFPFFLGAFANWGPHCFW